MRIFLMAGLLALVACTGERGLDAAGAAADEGEVGPAPAVDAFATVPAPARSLQRRAWEALQRTDRVEVVSLDPNSYFTMPDIDAPYGSPAYRAESERMHGAWLDSRARLCRRVRCVGDHVVVGSTTAKGEALAAVRAAMQEPLTRLPDYATACAPIYRHGLAFRDGDTRWEMKLCFGCGQIAIGRDAKWSNDEQAAGLEAESLLNSLLRRAGQRLAPPFGAAQPSA